MATRYSVIGESVETPAARDQISLAEIARAFRRNRGVIVGTAAVCAALGAWYAATRPTAYTSRALFRPDVQQSQTQVLAGVASQLGIAIPSGGQAVSPETYAELASSREILLPVAAARYSYRRGARRAVASLVDIYEPRPGNFAARRDATVSTLAKGVSAGVMKSGSIELRVTTPVPELSQQVAGHIIAQIDSLYLDLQQGRAAQERAFVEQQLASASRELAQSENRVAAFLSANRQFGTPELALERERLDRDVMMRQQLYTSLASAYEQARLDEVRAMPVIAILEQPEMPYAPEPRRPVFFALLGGVLGGALGILLAFARETIRSLGRLARAGGGDASSAIPDASGGEAWTELAGETHGRDRGAVHHR